MELRELRWRCLCVLVAGVLYAAASDTVLADATHAGSKAPLANSRGRADPLASVKAHIRLKEFAAAKSELQQLSESGNAQAQYLLGIFYLNGLHGPRDVSLARVWLERAADQGDGRAAYSLASLSADAPKPDQTQVDRWLARAHQLGFEPPVAEHANDASLPMAGAQAYSAEPQIADEALWLAIARGDLPGVRQFVSASSVSAHDSFGRGALPRAAQSGNAEIVSLLLARGAPADAADNYGTTPLMLAAASGSESAVDALLKSGAGVNAADHGHNTVLMYAASEDKPEVAERLLKAGASVNAHNLQDWSALDFAVNRNLPAVAARLRNAGATAMHHNTASAGELVSIQRPRPPERDLYAGWPDVAVAAGLHTNSVLQSLLQHGIDPNVQAGSAPVLNVAALIGTPQSVNELLDARADPARTDVHGDSALQVAVRAGREDVVRALLARGVSPDDRNSESGPPLLTAVRTRKPAIVHDLMASHAHLDWQDARGQNALMVAAAQGDAAVLRELLQGSPALELEDKNGRTALWYAAQSGSLEKTQLLVAQGARLDHGDAQGLDALQIACAGGHNPVIGYLLGKGARVDVRSRTGDTPLHIAAGIGHGASIDQLLAAHADPDAQNEFGDTPMIIASRRGDAALVKRLLTAGASSRLRNHDRLTAADVAEARAFHSVRALLDGA